jgi:peptidoglycan pentaglycine glycine transferase (the first glycine)
MGINIKEIQNKVAWDSFIDAVAPSTFMHAYAWGEAERATGKTIYRIGIFEDEKQVAAFLVVVVRARRGAILLCPHGPIFATGTSINELLTVIRHEMNRIGRKEKCTVIRMCSLLPDTEENQKLCSELGFIFAPIHVYPELSWVLDISVSDGQLLSGMKKNTRYGIRKAERDGITITSSVSDEDFETFWQIYSDTAKRQAFVPHPEKLVRAEFAEFKKDERVRIYLAHHEGKPISTAFIVYGRDSAFYHHGASMPHQAITPGELLQWQVIKDAKARGLHKYNFWGVVPEGKGDHAWSRLDKFKRGFGGVEEAYLRTQDCPLTLKYAIMFIIERVRRFKRKV